VSLSPAPRPRSAPLAALWRADLLESLHRGHAVIADASGGIVAAWGDPEAVIYPRSSAKILQALPLMDSGAGAGLSQERLALACASHEGGAIHVLGVERWLADLGLEEADLRCGPQMPDDTPERRRLRALDQAPCQLHNNCSGKHAGFLMLGQRLGGGSEYIEIDHPVQKAVRTAFEEMTDAPSPHWGIDGCSAPNFATTVSGLARAMARLARPEGLGRARGEAAEALVAAMIAHPELVAGDGRACTELMLAMKGAAAIKTGAEGVYVAILPERGLGVALKAEDGATRAAECAIAALLVRLGVLDPADPACERRMVPVLANRRGLPAARFAPEPELWEGGKPI
jgi:L-asparaginase II